MAAGVAGRATGLLLLPPPQQCLPPYSSPPYQTDLQRQCHPIFNGCGCLGVKDGGIVQIFLLALDAPHWASPFYLGLEYMGCTGMAKAPFHHLG